MAGADTKGLSGCMMQFGSPFCLKGVITTMIGTEMRAFEAQINLTLLDNIISFVFRTVSPTPPQRKLLEQRCMFPIRAVSAQVFQEQYGFLYLGELLERYEERFGMPEADRRAIALALGYTRDIATKEMFVGSQRADFIQTVERAAQGDVYLTGALYLLSEGDSEGPAYEKRLTERQYARTEELVFAMSLFEPERALALSKAQLVLLLGPNRTMPVLENAGIFGWLVGRLSPLKKLLKSKEFAPVRALLTLPVSFVRPGSKPYDCLKAYGYTPLEIAYANLAAVDGRWLDNGLNPFGLSAEKIAVQLFRTVLTQEEPLPADVYPQLTQAYEKHSKFEIKYCETHKLADTLKTGVRIGSAETMAWFIQRDSVFHPAVDSFDVLEAKWDSLANTLKDDDYRHLFENSLTDQMSGAELKDRIARYDALTQGSYLDFYRKHQNGRRFSLLVNADLFDLWAEFQNSRPGQDTAAPGMMDYIRAYLEGVRTPQAFRFLQKFMPQYGCTGLNELFCGHGREFDHQLWTANSYSGVSVTLTLQREFLADDPAGQLLLLHWAEEYFFTVKPAHYLAFIQAALENERATGLLPQEELRKLFDLLLTQSTLSAYDANSLKQRYFTPEELQADQKARDAEELAEKRQKQDAEILALREEYAQKADGTFQSVWKFIERYYYRFTKTAAARIIHEDLDRQITETGGALTQKDAPYFLCLCARLLEYGAMDWAEALAHISKIKEVLDDDPGRDTAG